MLVVAADVVVVVMTVVVMVVTGLVGLGGEPFANVWNLA